MNWDFLSSNKSARNKAQSEAKKLRKLILSQTAPDGLVIKGHLDLSDARELSELPADLTATSLDLTGCTALRALPPGLQVGRLNLSGCTALENLPAGLRCHELNLSNTLLRALPDDLQVAYKLDLSGCVQLERLPNGLRVGTLLLRGCTALAALPEGLEVCFLDVSGCVNLRGWPRTGRLQYGHLRAAGCMQLTTLPDWVTEVAQLDVNGCATLTALPSQLRVSSWLDLAETGLHALPATLQGVPLRWRGVPIDERIAFRPETITAQEVLQENNLELRRVLLERMGNEVFLEQAQAQLVHRDRDPGGERRLLRVPLPGDEDLVCLSVFCPSTNRQYILRVPPTMRTCHQAAAWIAGFDNPDEYRPVQET